MGLLSHEEILELHTAFSARPASNRAALDASLAPLEVVSALTNHRATREIVRIRLA